MSKGSWHSQEFERPEPTFVPEEPRPQRARKDTKRWCKGKVGREHTPEVTLHHMYAMANHMACHESTWWPTRWFCRHIQQCTACGKHLREFLPKEECPTWLSQQ